MPDAKIPGGYYLKARCIKDSAIAHAPPYVRELWDYLLREANHSEVKYAGFTVKRGQVFKSYKEIRDDLCWYVGYRKERYNENQTKKGMRYLRKELMIDTMKEPRGVLITVLNYDHFQNPKNYERTNDGTNERTNEEPMKNQSGPSINKNEKNVNNERNKDILSGKLPDAPQENNIPYKKIIEYLNRQAGTAFKPNTKVTKAHIRARWNEGFRLEDFHKVIDRKCDSWKGDPRMVDYLRPQTLFGTKFEAYLNETGEGGEEDGYRKFLERHGQVDPLVQAQGTGQSS